MGSNSGSSVAYPKGCFIGSLRAGSVTASRLGFGVLWSLYRAVKYVWHAKNHHEKERSTAMALP